MKCFKRDKGVPEQTPLVLDDAVIDVATRCFGVFCNVTITESTAKENLKTYQACNLIEKTFKGSKTNFGLGVISFHEDDRMEGRFPRLYHNDNLKLPVLPNEEQELSPDRPRHRYSPDAYRRDDV